MIRVTSTITIGDDEIEERFVRAGGPGGQHVNKVATAVELRFDVRRSPSLPEDVRARLARLAGRRMSAAGVLVIDARRYRSQERNRRDALERLVALVRRAARRPKSRRTTKPTRASKEKRLAEKKRRGDVKRLRRRLPPSEQ